jgi:excisionase family DNA binding protein
MLTISTSNRIILPSYRGGVSLDDELLSIERVAKILDVHPDTVRRYVRQKKLKAVRLSSTNLRIRRSELDRFIKERETD